MSHNKHEGYEEVESNGRLFLFKADFGFLVSLKELFSVDPFIVCNTLFSGNCEPIYTRNVLIASLQGEENASIADKTLIIEELITIHGMQECWILAQHLLSHAMIGSKKKSQIMANQNLTSILVSRSRSLKNHVLLWVYLFVISMVCQCISIKLLDLLIV